MPDVLAFAETRAGVLRRIALETITAARRVADAVGGEVHAVLAGASGIASHAEPLGRHGADRVLVAEHAGFEHYNAEALAALVADRLAGGDYRAVVVGASVHGRDLAPRVAAKQRIPIAADVTSITVDGDVMTVTHPMNAGKLIATVKLSGPKVVLSVRPNVFTATEAPRAGTVETIAPSGNPSQARVKVTSLTAGKGGKLDLSEAPVIVSGGRGLRAPENFRLVEELADAFGNAAVGCTRAVTDEGWRPHSDQIGQTGRVVSPELYVAVGISGAIQHLAGMRTAKTIVAINKDREAPIFKIADYGIVGDAFEIVPELTRAVRDTRAKG